MGAFLMDLLGVQVGRPPGDPQGYSQGLPQGLSRAFPGGSPWQIHPLPGNPSGRSPRESSRGPARGPRGGSPGGSPGGIPRIVWISPHSPLRRAWGRRMDRSLSPQVPSLRWLKPRQVKSALRMFAWSQSVAPRNSARSAVYSRT